MDRERQHKVQKYEEFVDRRLKPDLLRAMAERDKVFEQQKILYPSKFSFVLSRVGLYLEIITKEGILPPNKKFFSSDLKRNIENLEKNNVTSLRALVNLGSEVYMQANVPDTSHIFVDVGLGFHVEFTRSEALNFIGTKEEQILRRIDEYTHLIASIKAQIKMVCEGIREILQLPMSEL